MRDYETYCDKAQEALKKIFWDEQEKLMRHKIPHDRTENYCYWWHAHVIDVLVDGYLRTKDNTYITKINDVLDGAFVKNGKTLLNDYYDDMQWMALALLRVWDIIETPEYKEKVLYLWNDIKTAWNDNMGGGMAWRKDQLDYKNTPANAPASILASRLYQRFHNEDDLQWAMKIYSYNKKNLVNPENGFVWDGWNRLGDGKVDYDWEYTYCQGVFIGAALELYMITKDTTYINDAMKTAKAAKHRFADRYEGILPFEGEGDCGLFKGIYIRYLSLLALFSADADIYKEMIYNNANTIIDKGMDDKGLTGPQLDQKPTTNVELSSHLSAMMILEMASMLQTQCNKSCKQ